MKTIALVEDGFVTKVYLGETNPFENDLSWVDAGDTVVAVGYFYEDGAFIAPEEPTVEPALPTVDEQLLLIDRKKIRAITEYILTGDKTRLEALEAHAAALRAQPRG